MKNKWFSILIALCLLAFSFGQVQAQTYLFNVQNSQANVYVNTDGTISIEYTLDFYNDPSASPIDFVDIGTPNDEYDLNSITAEINGERISDIQVSNYVDHGVALGLGTRAIPPGRTGRVHVKIGTVRKMLYPSTAEGVKDYASIEFSPTWFGSQYVNGNTDMTVTLILPPGIEPEEPRYHAPRGWPCQDQPESGYDDQNRVFYRWQCSQATSSDQYYFGASFPDRLVPKESIVRAPLINIKLEDLCIGGFCLTILGLIGVGIYQGIWGARKRKMQYLPPRIAVEGNGIKRGLTAVEAAILMEQPMDRILTMILFSTIKKNAATVTQREPLTLKVASPLPEELQPYERKFLQAFLTDNAKTRRSLLQETMVELVKSVTEKLKGFSRKETLAYYKSVVEKAWQMVETANTPEVKSQKFEEVMDWTMADGRFDDRSRDVFRTGPVIVPTWWGRYDPTYHPTISRPSTPSSSGGSISMPTLPGADFAASMVNSVQTFSAGVIGDLTSFTGKITDQTNPPPPPPPTRSGGGGGGGGGRSCACACACAGCACACAGGGR